MIDIAELGMEVRSDGVVVARDRLKAMHKEASTAELRTEKLVKRMKSMETVANRVGRAMSMYVTAPLTAAAAASIKLASEFGSTLTTMNTLVGVSVEEIQKMETALLALAPAVGVGPRELADALFAVTSAGQRGAQALGTLEAAAKASAVGLGDTRSIALAATAAVRAYGEENLSSSQAVEILVGTIEQGNLAAEELAPVLGRVIGTASQLGVAFEDVGGFIASFTRLGVDAAESTTALRGVLASVMKPTAEAEETFKALGTSVEGFRDMIRDQGFTSSFEWLVKRMQDTNTDVTSLIPNVRALSGVFGVFGGEAGAAQEVTDGVAAAIGTLDERFRSVQENDPSFPMRQFRAESEALFIELGQALLPAFNELIVDLQEVVRWFRELNPETQNTVVKFAAVAAAIGPLALVLAGVSTVVRTLIPLFVALRAAMLFMGPVGWLITAVSIVGSLVMALRGAEEPTSTLADEMRRLAAEMETMNQSAQVTKLIEAGNQIKGVEDKIASLREEQAFLARRNQIPGFALISGRSMKKLEEEIAELEAEAKDLREGAAELGKAMGKQAIAAAKAAEENKRLLNEIKPVTPTIKTALPVLDEYVELMEELAPSLTEAEQAAEDFRFALDSLDEMFTKGKIGLDDYEAGVEAARKKFAEFRDAIEAAEIEEHNRDVLAASDAYWRLEASLRPAVAEQLRLEEAQNIYKAALDKGIISQTEYNEKIAELPGLLDEAEDEVDGFTKAMERGIERLDDAIGNMWTDFLENGEVSFDGIKSAFSSMISEMIHQAVTRPIMLQFQNMMTGQGGQGGGFQLGPQFWNGMAIAGGVFGGSMLGGGGDGASIGSMAGAAIGMAFGPIGALIGGLLGGLVGGSFDRDPGLTLRGDDGGGAHHSRVHSPFGEIVGIHGSGGVGHMDMPGTPAGRVGEALVQMDQTIADFLNEEQFDAVTAALRNWDFAAYGDEFSVEAFMEDRFQTIMSVFDSSIQDFVAGAVTLEDQIKRLAVALTLDRLITENEEVLGGRTFEQFAFVAEEMRAPAENLIDALDRLIQMINATIVAGDTITEFIGTDLATSYDDLVAQMNMTMRDSLIASGSEIQDLIAGFDGTAGSVIDIADRVRSRYEMELEYLGLIDRVMVDVVSRMAGLRESILSDLSTPEENYARYKGQADELAAQLLKMTDPEQIQATVAEIERLTRRAYGTLSDEQKGVMGQEFLDFIDEVSTIAQGRLTLAREEALADAEDLRTQLEEWMTTIGDPLLLVATELGISAQMLEDAANVLNPPSTGGPGGGGGGGRGPVEPPNLHPGPNAYEEAVKSGAREGTKGLQDASVDVANALIAAADRDNESARILAAAINGMPGRIVIEVPTNEFG